MEITGLIKAISNDYITGDLDVTLSINEKTLALPELEKLRKLAKLNIKIVRYREKRSLDANRYAWQLMSQIAEVLRLSDKAVYETILERYGTNAVDDDENLITISVPSKVDIKNADIHCAFMGKGYVGDKEFNHYRVIKGSSMYNTLEMSRLIDGIVSECKELEIETLPPEKLRAMKERWGV